MFTSSIDQTGTVLEKLISSVEKQQFKRTSTACADILANFTMSLSSQAINQLLVFRDVLEIRDGNNAGIENLGVARLSKACIIGLLFETESELFAS